MPAKRCTVVGTALMVVCARVLLLLLPASAAHTAPLQPRLQATANAVATDALNALCLEQADAQGCAQDELVSFDFQDTELRPVLKIIADVAAVNMVVSDAVSGRITLKLTQLHWQQALALILRTKGLAYHLAQDVLIIGTQAEIAAQEEAALKHKKRQEELAPLLTEHIQILHANATDIASFLTQKTGDSTPGSVFSRGRIFVDERTNAIILTDTKKKIAVFRSVIAKVDVPTRQILIEARIVTANTNFSRQIGVRWGAASFSSNRPNNGLVIAGSRDDLSRGRSDGIMNKQLPLNVDLGIAGSQASRLSIGLFANRFILDLELSALTSEGHGEVIARPKIVTADKQSATITSGVEIPFQESSASGATATSFKQAVMTLEVKPRITPDDSIAMDLRISQDSLGAIVSGTPLINTNNIHTKVLVKDGDTIVLGGIYRTQKTTSVTKTPVLGDIPILGRLFRRTIRMQGKQELLVFITPQIIRPAPAWVPAP